MHNKIMFGFIPMSEAALRELYKYINCIRNIRKK